MEHYEAEIAWLIYKLEYDRTMDRFHLVRVKTVYTPFSEALGAITTSEAGEIKTFEATLRDKLLVAEDMPGC